MDRRLYFSAVDESTAQALQNAGVNVPGVTDVPQQPSWLVPALAFVGLAFLYKLSHSR